MIHEANGRFAKNYLCSFSSVCTKELRSLPSDAEIVQLRACVVTMHDMMVKIGPVVQEGFDGCDAARAWLSRHVLATAFGDLVPKLNTLSDAVNAQPEGLDSLLVNRAALAPVRLPEVLMPQLLVP